MKSLINSMFLFSHYIIRIPQPKKLNDNFRSQNRYTLSHYIRARQIHLHNHLHLPTNYPIYNYPTKTIKPNWISKSNTHHPHWSHNPYLFTDQCTLQPLRPKNRNHIPQDNSTRRVILKSRTLTRVISAYPNSTKIKQIPKLSPIKKPFSPKLTYSKKQLYPFFIFNI